MCIKASFLLSLAAVKLAWQGHPGGCSCSGAEVDIISADLDMKQVEMRPVPTRIKVRQFPLFSESRVSGDSKTHDGG